MLANYVWAGLCLVKSVSIVAFPNHVATLIRATIRYKADILTNSSRQKYLVNLVVEFTVREEKLISIHVLPLRPAPGVWDL